MTVQTDGGPIFIKEYPTSLISKLSQSGKYHIKTKIYNKDKKLIATKIEWFKNGDIATQIGEKEIVYFDNNKKPILKYIYKYTSGQIKLIKSELVGEKWNQEERIISSDSEMIQLKKLFFVDTKQNK
jgi:hypothetical protein